MRKLAAGVLGALVVALAIPALAGATRTVTLDVRNMDCAACPITVKKAISKVPGVVGASVDYDRRSALVTFDPDKTNVEAITRATANAGYPSSLKR